MAMTQTYLKEILSLKCTGWHPIGVYDKQVANQSLLQVHKIEA